MNFLHSQYIARITGGRNKTQKKERKLWCDFQSRNVSFENETRTKTKTTSTFDSIYEYFLCGQRNLESDARLASPRLDSTRRWRGGQKSAKRTGVVRKWVKMTSATRTRTERLSNREVIFARDGRDRLSMPPFLLFFFFFFHSSSRNTNTGICNKYIYIYARTKLVRKRIDGKTNLQGD